MPLYTVMLGIRRPFRYQEIPQPVMPVVSITAECHKLQPCSVAGQLTIIILLQVGDVWLRSVEVDIKK